MNREIQAACPYPGLRRFDASNARLYFGRERETQAVLERLRRSRFLAVTGESGCGKSSLIRAGVIPALQAGALNWRIAVMQPGADPLGRLAGSLAMTLAEPDPGEAAVPWTEIIEAALRSSSAGVAEVLRQARLGPEHNLLILVDQFEEIFRYKNSGAVPGAGDEARAFIRLLLTATAGADRRVHAILTMRSDFLGDCAQFAGLPEAINRGEFLVSRMTRDELRRAIAEPATVADTAIAPRLVARLLNEVGDNPGELPVLQHTLMRTWGAWRKDHSDAEPMDVRHYEAIGTLERALSQHADEVFDQLEKPELKDTAERVFRALTEMPAGGRPVRRPTPFGQLCRIVARLPAEVEAVVRAFGAPDRSFVSYPDDGTGPLPEQAMIDLTHESLITGWGRLREWVANEVRDADLYRALARDAGLHEQRQRSLWRNPELALATRWRDERRPNPEWSARYAPGFDEALAFLEASGRAFRRQQMTRRAVVAAGLGIAILAISTFAWAQRANAAAQRLRADAAVSEKGRLEKRLQELTLENPQLSDTAVRLRKENRDLEWNILQLQRENDRRASQIAALELANQTLEAGLKSAAEERAEVQNSIAQEERAIAALAATRSQLDQDVKARQATWTALAETNRKLREAAVQAGMLPAPVEVSASLARPPRDLAVERVPQTSAQIETKAAIPDSGTLDKLRFQVQQLERENLVLKQSIEELQEHNRRLVAQQAEELNRASRLKAALDQLQDRNGKLNAELRQAQAALEQARTTLRQREAEHRDAALQVEALQWRIRQDDNAIAGLMSENEAITRAMSRRK
jgi:hypothetical protein